MTTQGRHQGSTYLGTAVLPLSATPPRLPRGAMWDMAANVRIRGSGFAPTACPPTQPGFLEL